MSEQSKDRRQRARAALARQRIRAAANLMRAAGKVKEAGRAVSEAYADARGTKCPSCGGRMSRAARFCTNCGGSREAPSREKAAARVANSSPPRAQRILAQVIDRLLPLPFLVPVSPKWVWAVGLFHLLCEMRGGRSPGKWLCRIRVVDARTQRPCGPIRGMLRRVGIALSQVAYCRWEWVPLALGYDLLSFLFLWADRDARRIEDALLGTRVIGERRFREMKRQCGGCKTMIPSRLRFCPHCGKERR